MRCLPTRGDTLWLRLLRQEEAQTCAAVSREIDLYAVPVC